MPDVAAVHGRQQSKSGDVKGTRTGATSTVAVARSSTTASQVSHLGQLLTLGL